MKSFSVLCVALSMLTLSFPSFAKEKSNESSDNSLQIMKEGNQRFVSGQSIHVHQDLETLKNLVKGQNPKCIIVSCADSRVPPEIIFDQGLGDIFSIRTAGNVMSDYEEGSVEYAVEHLKTPLVIVMGHQGCGAIQAMLDSPEVFDGEQVNKIVDHVSKIVEKLKSEDEEKQVLKESGKNSNLAVVANVTNGVKQLRQSDPILKDAYEKGEINIIGAVYHLDSGVVEFLDL